jgi:hypothetical protein
MTRCGHELGYVLSRYSISRNQGPQSVPNRWVRPAPKLGLVEISRAIVRPRLPKTTYATRIAERSWRSERRWRTGNCQFVARMILSSYRAVQIPHVPVTLHHPRNREGRTQEAGGAKRYHRNDHRAQSALIRFHAKLGHRHRIIFIAFHSPPPPT